MNAKTATLPPTKQGAFDNDAKLWSSYRRLWRDWMRRYWYLVVVILLLTIISAASAAGYAKFIQWVIEAFQTKSQNVVYWGPPGIIFLTVFKGGAQYASATVQARFLSRIQVNMQKKMFSSLIYTDLTNLMTEAPAALGMRFMMDVVLVRGSIQALFGGLQSILTITFAFGVMFSIDWVLTLGILVIFLFSTAPIAIIGARVRDLTQIAQRAAANMLAQISENLTGIRMVRTYGLEEHLKKVTSLGFEALYKLNVKIVRLQAATAPITEIFSGLAIAFLLLLVGIRINQDAVTVPEFVGFLTALGVATPPSRQLGGSYTAILQGLVALGRIFGMFDAKNKIKDGAFDYPKGEKSGGSLSFEHVDFEYPGGFRALHDINLQVEAGKTYALVGRSGAGKSTIFSLIPRLFDVSAGVIKIDGRPLADFKLPALRDQISVVSQDSVLLSGTVLENIAYGREGASEEDCIAAAKAAAAHEFIEKLPAGYHTDISAGQSNFSGGERQRLSIARAIVRDAPILILDEPTSALDSVSETAIRQALADLSRGRTTLVIAHRLSTILDADQIVVMQEGRIVDQGKHAELIERDGIYNTLYELQFNQKSIVAKSKDDEKQSPKKPAKKTGGFLSAWRDFLNEKN